MREEEKIFEGILFKPGHPDLVAIKLKTHNLNVDYNKTYEHESEKRAAILQEMIGEFGEGSFIQGPVHFHYGIHTSIGKRFFGNFNLTIQDDAKVTIGDDVSFGPNVTIVTPLHPLLPEERSVLYDAEGNPGRYCYAKPVRIGNNCWFGANVVVGPGVTIGDNCVIGAGSVVVNDIPSMSVAVGNPARVLRQLSEQDSIANRPEVLGDVTVDPPGIER